MLYVIGEEAFAAAVGLLRSLPCCFGSCRAIILHDYVGYNATTSYAVRLIFNILLQDAYVDIVR